MRTQQLTIRYFPKNGTIVDIYGEEKEFYSMDSYNEARKGERIGILCSFVILETVWGIALFGFTLTIPRGYKLFCKIKRRKK